MADGNTVINLKRGNNQPQKLIYIEEEERGKKRSKEKNSDLKNTYQFQRVYWYCGYAVCLLWNFFFASAVSKTNFHCIAIIKASRI